MADFEKFRNSEVHKFGRQFLDDNTDPFFKFEDPTYLGFKPLFNFNKTSGLLAGEENINSALAYLNRIGDQTRKTYLQTFINLLRDISIKAGWYFILIEGLEDAWKRDFNMPLLIDKKISFGCRESLDLRITAMIDCYRKACFDWENRREVVPSNLRSFEVSVYVYDYRIFNDFKNKNDASSAKKKQDLLQLFGNNDFNFEADDHLNIGRTTNRMVFKFKRCKWDLMESAEHLTNVNNATYEVISQKLTFSYSDVEEENVYNMFLNGTVSDDTLKALNEIVKNDIRLSENSSDGNLFANGFGGFSAFSKNLNDSIAAGNENNRKLGEISENPKDVNYPTDDFNIRNFSIFSDAENLISLANLAASEVGRLFLQNSFDSVTFNQIEQINQNIFNNQVQNLPTEINQNIFDTPTNNPIISILEFIEQDTQITSVVVNDQIPQNITNVTNSVNDEIDINLSNLTDSINEDIDTNSTNETQIVTDNIQIGNIQNSQSINDIIFEEPSVQNVDLDLEFEIPFENSVDLDIDLQAPQNTDSDLDIDLTSADNETLKLEEFLDINIKSFKNDLDIDLKPADNLGDVSKIENLDIDIKTIKSELGANIVNDIQIKNELSDIDLNIPNNKENRLNELLEFSTKENSNSLENSFIVTKNDVVKLDDFLDFAETKTVANDLGSIDTNVKILNTELNFNIFGTPNDLTTNLGNFNIFTNDVKIFENDLSINLEVPNNKVENIKTEIENNSKNLTTELKDSDVVSQDTKNDVTFLNEILNFGSNNKTEKVDSIIDFNVRNKTIPINDNLNFVVNNETETVNEVLQGQTNNPQQPLPNLGLVPFRPNFINPEEIR